MMLPGQYEEIYRAPYQALQDSIGIGSPEGLARKAILAEELLTRVMLVAGTIVGGVS